MASFQQDVIKRVPFPFAHYVLCRNFLRKKKIEKCFKCDIIFSVPFHMTIKIHFIKNIGRFIICGTKEFIRTFSLKSCLFEIQGVKADGDIELKCDIQYDDIRSSMQVEAE